ncbi:MAG: prepilin-type N-terminal cleavage/methylation domain-containing protein [Desulfobacteraceae bacterium]|nr:prepilin-type N-terminal cleavage/methylation domain-containing protein [Desulfobacteraceae bacterium]
MNPKTTKNNKGFTLIELMIAMVIFVIVVALIADNYFRQQDQHVTQNQVVEIQQNARAGFQMIINEIRMAGHDPYNKSDAGININMVGDGSNLLPLEFTYYTDNNNDGDTDDTGEFKTIRIRLFDSTIDRNLSPPFDNNDEIQITPNGTPIAENIAALEFTYFDIDGDEITPAINGNIAPSEVGNIIAIRVLLTARPDESERNLSGSNRTLESMIKLRNI